MNKFDQFVFDVEIAADRLDHAASLFDAIEKLLKSGEHKAALGLAKIGREIALQGADEAAELGGSIEQEGGKQ